VWWGGWRRWRWWRENAEKLYHEINDEDNWKTINNEKFMSISRVTNSNALAYVWYTRVISWPIFLTTRLQLFSCFFQYLFWARDIHDGGLIFNQFDCLLWALCVSRVRISSCNFWHSFKLRFLDTVLAFRFMTNISVVYRLALALRGDPSINRNSNAG
jgi:hypothetical protein